MPKLFVVRNSAFANSAMELSLVVTYYPLEGDPKVINDSFLRLWLSDPGVELSLTETGTYEVKAVSVDGDCSTDGSRVTVDLPNEDSEAHVVIAYANICLSLLLLGCAPPVARTVDKASFSRMTSKALAHVSDRAIDGEPQDLNWGKARVGRLRNATEGLAGAVVLGGIGGIIAMGGGLDATTLLDGMDAVQGIAEATRKGKEDDEKSEKEGEKDETKPEV